MGRQTTLKPEYADQARKLCELGATDEEVAEFFNVVVRTIYRWQASNPAFSQALKVGKSVADDRVERSLFHKAVGYKHEAVKIFMPANAPAPVYAPYVEHVAPDTVACIFWLKNRRPDLWRDKREMNISLTTRAEALSDDALARVVSGDSSEGTVTSPSGPKVIN